MPTPRASRRLRRDTPPNIATLVLISGCAALSMNLFLPSLPNMTAFFGTQYGIMQIAVAGYLGVNAILQLVIGPLADRYGRRATLLGCIAIFVLASLGCALSQNVWLFLAFRMIQAVIVAGIALPRAVIRDLFEEDRAASMIGWVTMGMAVSPMLAPAIGGLLDGAFGWTANFWALAALGVASFALAYADMGETAAMSGGNLRQQMAQYPQLLLAPRFWGYALTAAFASGAFFAYLGGAPYVGSEVYAMSPERLGIYFGAPAIGYMVGNGISGRYSNAVGIRRMIAGGTVVTVLGLGAGLAVDLAGYHTPLSFFGFMIFVGLGNGLVIPNSMAGMLSVRPHLAGTASGLGGSIMIGGGAALSTLAGVLLEHGEGATPLLWLMVITSVASVVAIALTIRREKRLEAAGEAAPAE